MAAQELKARGWSYAQKANRWSCNESSEIEQFSKEKKSKTKEKFG